MLRTWINTKLLEYAIDLMFKPLISSFLTSNKDINDLLGHHTIVETCWHDAAYSDNRVEYKERIMDATITTYKPDVRFINVNAPKGCLFIMKRIKVNDEWQYKPPHRYMEDVHMVISPEDIDVTFG